MGADRNCSRTFHLAMLGMVSAALFIWLNVRQTAAQTATTATGAATTVVNTGNIVNIVGGVRVDVNGVLNQQDERGRAQVLEARRRAMQEVPGDINQPAKLRMVSLKNLDAAIEGTLKNGKVLPDEIKYLAGLQRVQYVFVYPEEKDVVIAGPAEGWKLNEAGIIVGSTSGHPVMQLDDLLVALRYAEAHTPDPMSVSIDPTPEGLQRLRDFTAKIQPNANRQASMEAINHALGPQKITDHRRAGFHATCERHGRRGLSHEMLGNGCRSFASERHPKLFANGRNRRRHAASLVARAEVRSDFDRRPRSRLGTARPGGNVHGGGRSVQSKRSA